MSLLLSCQAISKAYGAAPLFEQLSFGLFEGDRVGLVGPNGSGKSTLLRILAGIETPDSGTRSVRKLLRLGYVPQDPSFPPDQRIEEIVTAALDDDHLDADERHTRVNVTLAKVGFPDAQQRAANAVGRLDEAPGDRLRAGARARPAADGRAHQPSRRRGHPVAGEAAAHRKRWRTWSSATIATSSRTSPTASSS